MEGCHCDWIVIAGACSSNDGSRCWSVCCLGGANGDRGGAHIGGPGFALIPNGGGGGGACESPTLPFLLILLLGLAAFAPLLVKACKAASTREFGHVSAPCSEAERCLLGIGAASLVVLLSALLSDIFSFCLGAATVALALVPVITSSTLLLLTKRCALALDSPCIGSLSCGSCFGLFHAAWWAGATALLTFYGPFTVTSNAYFGCWGALAGAVALLVATTLTATAAVAKVRSAAAGPERALVGLLVASAVLLGACATRLADSVEARYIFVVCILTALVTLALLLRPSRIGPTKRSLLVAAVALLWPTVVWFATFAGPFGLTGNGFFSAWAGAAFAFLAVRHHASHHAGGAPAGASEPEPGPELAEELARARSVVSRSIDVSESSHVLFLLGVASLVETVASIDGRVGIGLYAASPPSSA